MNAGNLAASRGDAQTAIAQYRQALAIDPLFVAAYVNLADIYRATGNEVDAQVILRQGIKEFSSWPTVPQLYVKGEFVGGCDIVREMYESGELNELLSTRGVATQAA